MPRPPSAAQGFREGWLGAAAVENYVRAIHQTARGRGRVASTTGVALSLGLTPASVSSMFKKLARLELVVYVPYRGVSLTAAGTELALQVTRRRVVLESYLVDVLGMPPDQVHDEAGRLEHHVSPELEALLATQLDPGVRPAQPSAGGESSTRSNCASA